MYKYQRRTLRTKKFHPKLIHDIVFPNSDVILFVFPYLTNILSIDEIQHILKSKLSDLYDTNKIKNNKEKGDLCLSKIYRLKIEFFHPQCFFFFIHSSLFLYLNALPLDEVLPSQIILKIFTYMDSTEYKFIPCLSSEFSKFNIFYRIH